MGVCAHLWGQEWPYMRISMAAVMAMYAHIYGHVCAYLWAMYARIYGPCMRISMAAAMAIYARIYRGSSNGHVNK